MAYFCKQNNSEMTNLLINGYWWRFLQSESRKEEQCILFKQTINIKNKRACRNPSGGLFKFLAGTISKLDSIITQQQMD